MKPDERNRIDIEQRLRLILEEYRSKQLYKYDKISSLVNTFDSARNCEETTLADVGSP